MRSVVALLLVCVLASCGAQDEDSAFSALSPIVRQLGQNIGQGGAAGDGFTVTRASLVEQGFENPFLVARLDATNRRSGFVQLGTNQATITWVAADGATMSERAGVLSATRGLGSDLYTAETALLEQALRAGNSAVYPRRFRHLDSLGQIVLTRFDCDLTANGRETIEVFDLSYETRRFTETCRSQSIDTPLIENTYWRDLNSPIMRRSQQWVSTEVGYLTLERVLD